MREGLDTAIAVERTRRLRLKEAGLAYHYWQERGDTEPPRDEYWCNHCAGFFGVPHDSWTHGNGWCRNLGRFPGNRQCACIDCVVWEQRNGQVQP